MASLQKITPCLWFDSEAEEAATFYTGIFPNSRIAQISRYGEAGYEHHGKPPGTVMVVAFELDGQDFTAFNSRPIFKFNEAVSFQVGCANQAEVDHYWTRLSEGGEERAQQCGWLKDRFGLSWQIVPSILPQLIGDPDSRKSQQTFQAMLQMKKLDIVALQQAHDQ